MNRHKKQPFRWSGQMKNLSFFNFDEEEKRRVKFLNQTVLYIDCPRGNEPKAFKAIRDMFGSVFFCDYHLEHGKYQNFIMFSPNYITIYLCFFHFEFR